MSGIPSLSGIPAHPIEQEGTQPMKPATSEALAHLVSMYVLTIENHGGTIPEETVGQLATEPLRALEVLNDFAVALGAVDEQLDAVLQAVYESMDASDARSELDDAARTQVLRAYADAHHEPEPEVAEGPAPEVVPAEVAPADTAADAQQGEAGDGESAPKRRRKRRSKDAAEAEPSAKAPSKRSGARRATKKDAAAAESAAPVTEPAAAEPAAPVTEPAAADAPAAPKPAAEERPAEVLTVDQAVKVLGVSRPTVYKLIESGELPAFKKGRSWQISAEAVARRANS